MENFICTCAPLYLGSIIMVKRALLITIMDIKYFFSFTPFILGHRFLIISCEGFLSVSGVILCSVVHHPYSSYNAAVKFVVLRFSSLLHVPCQALFGKLSDLASFLFYQDLYLSPACKLFKAAFPISAQRYEKYSSYSQVSYCLLSDFSFQPSHSSRLHLFPAPGLTSSSPNLT